MAQVFDLREQRKSVDDLLTKGMSSSNLNFLLGAGCSQPAIASLGVTEENIDAAIKKGNSLEIESLTYDFLSPIIDINSKLISGEEQEDIQNTQKNYLNFLKNLQYLLYERRTSLHFNLINIFTTNYDLFIENAGAQLEHFFLNDGFCRNTNLQNKFYFSSKEFFHYRGIADYLYDYKIDVPVFNLIKLHGSLSWKLVRDSGDHICFNNKFPENLTSEQKTKDALQHYNQTCAVILPSLEKHKTSVITDVYYDLIRIFSYELERPNSMFFAIGFSFKDEHLSKLIRRALSNPSLSFIAFAYNEKDVNDLQEKFKTFNNFFIIKNSEIDENKQNQHKNLDFQEIVRRCFGSIILQNR